MKKNNDSQKKKKKNRKKIISGNRLLPSGLGPAKNQGERTKGTYIEGEMPGGDKGKD